MRTSIKAIDLIKQYEGCELKVYKDSKDFLTVGYGHKILPQDRLKLNQTITQEQADSFLAFDLARTEAGVDRLLHVDVTDNQFDALVSFAFNIGVGALERSSLLNNLNTKRFTTAADELLQWNHSGGVVVKGLLLRRTAERSLFLQS